jgi:predicted  nucleic acid-binding Zn-ribbon protein
MSDGEKKNRRPVIEYCPICGEKIHVYYDRDRRCSSKRPSKALVRDAMRHAEAWANHRADCQTQEDEEQRQSDG